MKHSYVREIRGPFRDSVVSNTTAFPSPNDDRDRDRDHQTTPIADMMHRQMTLISHEMTLFEIVERPTLTLTVIGRLPRPPTAPTRDLSQSHTSILESSTKTQTLSQILGNVWTRGRPTQTIK
ncbi:hypothetical protein A1F94_009301 [Pyrenophora tritici-repentis]|uniref:Uncharacterized protein n=1 Tax=Pyrenophora tritici-repentis TaxID=45151 RepID=A0A2W1G398_9PLEO|nr:hypothetical protein A1F99_101780 [Pyrenophora tritici-repentis]KAF7565459.1 hypothetical protein PtrM4_048930 [Pyrenophora tritici-repentis]KAG9380406.1 hypothetical protein A1F94_009301 [Pyrenophora tritici-repentis]KAI0577156.1 hypothetical protein Alg215_07075 [Pyrenophora tritici-repentis]KAI1665345.1 hypothetical protein L13192_10286 [Pyrenophora tritici-repentis]